MTLDNWDELLLSLQNTSPKRLVFDVDGVVADDHGGYWEGQNIPYADRNPYPVAVKVLRALKEAGHTLIFCTARYMLKHYGNQVKANEEGGQELRWWLKQHEIPYDEVYLGKPSGDLYVDDKACRVNSNRGIIDWVGTFGPTMKELTK